MFRPIDLTYKTEIAKDFVGAEAYGYLKLSALIGALWFAIESSFVFVIQGFLLSLGLIQQSETLFAEYVPKTIIGSMTLLFTFGLLRAIVVMAKNYFAGASAQAFIKYQRINLLRYALRNALQLNSDEIFTVFSERITQAGNVVKLFSTLLNNLMGATLIFILGIRLAPLEMLTGVLMLFVLLIPLKRISSSIKEYGKNLVKNSKKANTVLYLGTKNFFFLSLYNLTNEEIKKGNDALAKYGNSYKRYYLLSSLKGALPVFAGTMIISFITYLSLTYFKTSSVALISFFYIFVRLSQAVGEISASHSNMKLSWNGLSDLYVWHTDAKIFEQTQPEDSAESANTTAPPQAGRPLQIEFKNVSFRYRDNVQIIENLSFTVKTGETISIRGPSGSGKSTILKLLFGLATPQTGHVEISGIQPKDFVKKYASTIGYIGPEPYMIAGDVRANLLYGHPSPNSVNDFEIWTALEKASVANEIRELPGDLRYKMSEASPLSTGQKQRLSIARAFLRSPSLLILDEATANLDAKNEATIVGSIKQMQERCATIIISHKVLPAIIYTTTVSLSPLGDSFYEPEIS